MRLRRLVLALPLAAALLAGCDIVSNTAPPAPTATQPAPTATPATPPPAQGQATAYPAPAPPQSQATAYPAPAPPQGQATAYPAPTVNP
jgi:hypothetical protein